MGNSPYRIGKKRSTLGAVVTSAVAALALTLSGCQASPAGNTNEEGSAASGSDGAPAFEGETLTVLNWQGWGSDLEYAIDTFEAQTGATVEHRYISSLAEMVEILAQSGDQIDVALPNFQFIGPAIRQGLIQPLDKAMLDNFDDVYTALGEQDAFYSDGDLYGIPWVWGYSSVIYNPDATDAPTSIASLWDEQYAGKVALIDDATLNVLAACLYLGEDPTDPDLDRVRDALIDLKQNSVLITQSPEELAAAISAGTVEIGMFHSSSMSSMKAEGVPIELVLPDEGAVGWGDTWTISSGTDNVELAYEWLNFMTSPDFLTTWASDPAAGAPAPANSVAVAQLSDEAKARTLADPDTIEKLTLQGPLPDEVLEAWIQVWEDVKASN
jgi:spermidine/putrescine transport system substrate-binding protein